MSKLLDSGGAPYPFPVEKTLKSYVYINVTSRVFIFLQLLNRTKVWLHFSGIFLVYIHEVAVLQNILPKAIS